MRRRFARRQDLGLTKAEFAILRRLDTPEKIQSFLFGMKQNFEQDGETCHTVRVVLKDRRAHCIEGAVVAAAALWVHGQPPLLMDLQAVHDFDHVVALYRRNGCCGAISKTNGIGLRWRDPVFRSLRELAMSWFHEYTNKRNRKTLRTYSLPLDMRRIDPKIWVTGKDGAWDLVDVLEDLRHFKLVTPAQARRLTRRDPFERKVGALLQYPRPSRKR
jgi:hypothetical protein